MIGKTLNNICLNFSVAVFAFLIGVFSIIMYFNAPNLYQKEDKKFVIERGLTLTQVINKLHDEGIVRNPKAFLYISQLVKGYNPTVRYGEYFFEKHSSHYKIMHKMVRGYISFRKITIVEGLSSHSSTQIIDDSFGLVGNMPPDVAEGSMLPETYFYSYNDSKIATVKRMQEAMNKTIEELWLKRDESIPAKNKEEAIILASIVEKETGMAGERGKIASVFVNRLKKGMKLQSDPTIIYSFTFGDKNLERPIRKSDIRNKSEYNTYHIYGLPPKAICNPGIESIKAVLNPPTTDYLYFVASGEDGGHNFSTNLKDHNSYVRQYYRYLKEQRAAKEKTDNNT